MEVNRGGDYRIAVLDANVLIYSFLNKTDLVSQLKGDGFRILVPSSVVREIKNLSNKNIINFLEFLVEKKLVEVVESDKKGDEALIELAEKFGGYIITNDKNLRMRAKKRGIATGYLKEGKIIKLE